MNARRLLALATISLLVLAGCGGTDGGSDASDSPDTTEAGGADQPEESGFPVTVGPDEVEIPERPERIVSLSPTATEVLFAIGAGDQVVAADEQSTYPEEAPTTDLSGFTPNVEAIASHQPDLVVASMNTDDLVEGLARLDVPTLVHPSASTLDDTYTQIEQLGAATGHVDEAADVVDGMRADLDEIIAEAESQELPETYYHELDESFHTVTSETFVGELYGLIGMESIADEAEDQSGGYPQLSPEFILEADPDVILLADAKCCGVTAETVEGRASWNDLSAVQNGAIVELNDDLASRWGPRVVDFLDGLVDDLTQLN